MSAALVEERLLATNYVLSGAFPMPMPQLESALQLYFDIPAIESQITVPITEVEAHMESGHVIFTGPISNNVTLIITGTGKLNKEEDSFQIGHVNINIEHSVENARADFVASTIRAVLTLAGDIHIRIPSVQMNITLRFEEPLLDISRILRRRQIDYRAMVVERTIGHEFHLPIDISGDEVENLALTYHAIVEHSFDWPLNEVTVLFPAAKEWRDTLVRLRNETSISIGPHPFSLKLFGHKVELGQRRIIIKNAVIENFEAACKELGKEDGHEVQIVIRSTSGQSRYDFFGVPDPPSVMWDSNIQKMIELDSHLDAILVNHYHALAAATLAGLTEEDKRQVTTFPDMDEAFNIDAD